MIYVIDVDITIANNHHRSYLVSNACDCAAWIAEYTHYRWRYTRLSEGKIECNKCDGTGHRKPTDEEWKANLDPALVAKDKPVKEAFRVLREILVRKIMVERISNTSNTHVIFMTSRNDDLRRTTMDWISKHLGPEFDGKWTLLNRGKGDWRLATDYKIEHLRAIHAQYGNARNDFVYIDDDEHMYGVYQKFPGVWLRGPDCWKYIMPPPTSDTETWWKR